MPKTKDLKRLPAVRPAEAPESKAQLQRRMEEARESISGTVEEIKGTVEDQYHSIKETLGGVLDLREKFQNEPIVWSLGALAAGFALGYTLGYAHKNVKTTGRRRSEIAAFADSLVDELSTLGSGLVVPSINAKIKASFGFDLSDVLKEIGTKKGRRLARKVAARKTARRSRS